VLVEEKGGGWLVVQNAWNQWVGRKKKGGRSITQAFGERRKKEKGYQNDPTPRYMYRFPSLQSPVAKRSTRILTAATTISAAMRTITKMPSQVRKY
jgi:hypothetical protein